MNVKFIEERRTQNTVEYVFTVNRSKKIIRELDLLTHLDFYEVLPFRLKAKLSRNKLFPEV